MSLISFSFEYTGESVGHRPHAAYRKDYDTCGQREYREHRKSYPEYYATQAAVCEMLSSFSIHMLNSCQPSCGRYSQLSSTVPQNPS